MHITVNEELKAYIDPLTPDEHKALERSILAEGCRDALVLWGEVLVDGHNRYGICQKHGLPFKTVQNTRFQSMEDVHLWMIDQHLGRRSVSDFQRGVLALRQREILEERRAKASSHNAGDPSDRAFKPTEPVALKSRADMAKAARLSSTQIMQIEKIHRQAAPELVAAVKAGTISIHAAAAVATLPESEQKTAVMAGQDELKQVAKQVLSEKRKRSAKDSVPSTDAGEQLKRNLEAEITRLSEENQRLREELAQTRTQLQAVSNAPVHGH
jgi:hypothetical protein